MRDIGTHQSFPSHESSLRQPSSKLAAFFRNMKDKIPTWKRFWIVRSHPVNRLLSHNAGVVRARSMGQPRRILFFKVLLGIFKSSAHSTIFIVLPLYEIL